LIKVNKLKHAWCIKPPETIKPTVKTEEPPMATPTKTGDKPVKSKSVAPAKTAAKAAPKAAPKAAATAKPAKPVAKAPTAKAATAKVPAAKAPATKRAAPAKVLSPDQRRYYIEVAAYYIAERRGFHGGSEFNDWVNAEAEIDRLLREGVLNP
jgi:hypothetical protein